MFGFLRKRDGERASLASIPPPEAAAPAVPAEIDGSDFPEEASPGSESDSAPKYGILAAVQDCRALSADARVMAETYQQCREIECDIAAVEARRDTDLARIVANFQICREVLDKTFGERAKALDKHYETLDKALESNDREVIIAALHGISGIVTTNPLESFQETVHTLMNAKRDDVLQLEF